MNKQKTAGMNKQEALELLKGDSDPESVTSDVTSTISRSCLDLHESREPSPTPSSSSSGKNLYL